MAILKGCPQIVEMLLEDQRVDVNFGFDTDAISDSDGPLGVAFKPLAESMNALGGGNEDIMRCLILLLASRRVNKRQLHHVIHKARRLLPTEADIATAEAAGQMLSPKHRAVQLMYPILRAEATGKRRWCAWCFGVCPDDSRYDRETTRIRGYAVCTQCKEVGYCSMECQRILEGGRATVPAGGGERGGSGSGERGTGSTKSDDEGKEGSPAAGAAGGSGGGRGAAGAVRRRRRRRRKQEEGGGWQDDNRGQLYGGLWRCSWCGHDDVVAASGGHAGKLGTRARSHDGGLPPYADGGDLWGGAGGKARIGQQFQAASAAEMGV